MIELSYTEWSVQIIFMIFGFILGYAFASFLDDDDEPDAFG